MIIVYILIVKTTSIEQFIIELNKQGKIKLLIATALSRKDLII